MKNVSSEDKRQYETVVCYGHGPVPKSRAVQVFMNRSIGSAFKNREDNRPKRNNKLR